MGLPINAQSSRKSRQTFCIGLGFTR